MPQRVADYFVVAGLDFQNAKSLRLPGEAANQSKLWFFLSHFFYYFYKDDFGVEYGRLTI